MALIDCPECQRRVSTLADRCPSCGYLIVGNKEVPRRVRRRRAKDESGGQKFGYFFLVFGIIGLIACTGFTADKEKMLACGVLGGGLTILGIAMIVSKKFARASMRDFRRSMSGDDHHHHHHH